MEINEEEKLPEPLGSDDKCDDNPEFAVICSFLARFGPSIDINLNIEELKCSIEDQETLHDSLVDIHVKLLKKLRRYFVRDQWEKALTRYAYEYSHADGFEIDTMGYLKARPSIKMHLLRRLLDAQFECDPKFKAAVNLIDAYELNTKPSGRDIRGNTYWHCRDDYGNLRVYREEPLQHESWTTICKNADDLKLLIEQLDTTKEVRVKGEPQSEPYDPYPEIFPEYFVKKSSCDDAVETATRKVTKKSSRKGKKKGRLNKKSCPLQTVIEDEETIDQVDIEPLVSEQSQLKQQEPQDCRPGSASPNGSIESHVKYTLENILSTVVSSFDYIFRRKSPDVNPGSVPDNIEKKSNNSRKRVAKREKPKTEELPRRSSSRIQQLQQKKVEEEAIKRQEPEIKTRSIPELQSKESTSSRINGKSSNGKSSNMKSSRRDKRDKQRWRNKKGKKKLSWDKDDSDLSSISSLSESNDESFMEALDESIGQGDNDDEFACEDEVTNDEPVIIKRARTARQTLDLDETNGLNNSSILEEDKPCGRCDKSNDPDWILLCDMCDDGYHTTCCVPSLMYVPDGDWFCPLCEHKMLLQKLREVYDSVVELLAAKERERQKKQRPRQAVPKKDVTKIIESKIVKATSDESFKASSDESFQASSDESFHASSDESFQALSDELIKASSDESFHASSDESFLASSGTEEIEDIEDSEDIEDFDDEDEDDATEVSLEDDSSLDEIVYMHQSRSKNKKFKKTKKRRRFGDDSEDGDFKPRSRRVAAQKVSYKESSDSEDEILISRDVDPAPITPNPINELTQYCSQDSYPSNPLFSSFKMSPPHPQFYQEDETMDELLIDGESSTSGSLFSSIPKMPLKKPARRPGRPFSSIRKFSDRLYNDPFQWGLVKCIAFFTASVFVARTLSELDILPAEPSATDLTQSAY